MQKLQKARQNLRKNSRKGFTLIELIVVIVIIAILIAALAPAIMGVIERANRAADEADMHTLLLAATAAADFANGDKPANAAAIRAEITGNPPAIEATLYFEGATCIAITLTKGRSSNSPKIEIGTPPTNPAAGTTISYTPIAP